MASVGYVCNIARYPNMGNVHRMFIIPKPFITFEFEGFST